MKSSTLKATPFYYYQFHFWRCNLALLLLFWNTQMNAQDPIAQVTESLKPNVVAIKASFADGSEENGFGFITAERNGSLYLATAAHVVRGPEKDKTAQSIRVKFFLDISWYTATFKYHWDEEDLALLEVIKPEVVKWRTDCADMAPRVQSKVQFIGINGNEPSWVNPGLDGNIFEQTDKQLNFAISTIRPGTSGAPLITEKGIVGLITQDDGGISRALKLSQIRTLFSSDGQYPYFSLQRLGEDQYGLILVKGGTFIMGCTDEQGRDCQKNEYPPHSVTLSDFYLGKYEVTQAQWREVMGSDPPHLNFKGCDQCPVERVSWEDIQVFLGKLNTQTGRKYRLPTEAEWEYAARGGNLSKGYKYAGSNLATEVAWITDNSDNKTHPVGTKKANELGLYDMSGNVYEWCQDWYGYYPSDAQTNPDGPVSGFDHVIRGGDWDYFASHCRVPLRNLNASANRSDNLGFRLASSY